jgi:hypothetical protein
MPFSSIRDWRADYASLSSLWRSGLNPRDSKRVTACLYAAIMEGPLQSNTGSAWMKLPSYSYMTRMYWLPDVLGVKNLPVGSVNIMPVVAWQSVYRRRVRADGGSGGAVSCATSRSMVCYCVMASAEGTGGARCCVVL